MSKVAIFVTERQNYVFVKILLYFVFENVQFVGLSLIHLIYRLKKIIIARLYIRIN